jgi:hypothetical protein
LPHFREKLALQAAHPLDFAFSQARLLIDRAVEVTESQGALRQMHKPCNFVGAAGCSASPKLAAAPAATVFRNRGVARVVLKRNLE